MNSIIENDNLEQVSITYIDLEIWDNWIIKTINKTETGSIIFWWMSNRVSDVLNNWDNFLEFTNNLWVELIISKQSILYIIPNSWINKEALNINSVFANIELINWQKFFWEVNLAWKIGLKQLLESKQFIPLIQNDINRVVLINRNNIKIAEKHISQF